MSPMIRWQVYIEQRHDRMLKRRARRLRDTEADIICEAAEIGRPFGRGQRLSGIIPRKRSRRYCCF